MRRIDRIKLDFTRNWKLPGKERLSNWLKPSGKFKSAIIDGIVWLSDENIAIHTSADSYIEWTILSTGTYEYEINKLIRISLKNGDNALDIGGNIGLQSIRMAQCVGDTGKVYAFEPLIYLQKKLSRNISLNKVLNITIFPCALSDKESEADFAINKASWNQGTFSLTNDISGAEKQHVIVKVADHMSEIQSLSSLGLVKIDVEGFEYQVLQGLTQTLQKHKPRIIFEYDKNYWAKTNQNISDCYAFLSTLGYTCYQISPVGCELLKDAESINSGNLFCISLDL
jgi:FkbM family methyltransferase